MTNRGKVAELGTRFTKTQLGAARRLIHFLGHTAKGEKLSKANLTELREAENVLNLMGKPAQIAILFNMVGCQVAADIFKIDLADLGVIKRCRLRRHSDSLGEWDVIIGLKGDIVERAMDLNEVAGEERWAIGENGILNLAPIALSPVAKALSEKTGIAGLQAFDNSTGHIVEKAITQEMEELNIPYFPILPEGKASRLSDLWQGKTMGLYIHNLWNDSNRGKDVDLVLGGAGVVLGIRRD